MVSFSGVPEMRLGEDFTGASTYSQSSFHTAPHATEETESNAHYPESVPADLNKPRVYIWLKEDFPSLTHFGHVALDIPVPGML